MNVWDIVLIVIAIVFGLTFVFSLCSSSKKFNDDEEQAMWLAWQQKHGKDL